MKKIIASVAAACLLFTTMGDIAFAAHARENEKIIQNSIGFIPSNLGKVVDSQSFSSGKTIVNIQDLHCHAEVQKNICAIIEDLQKKYEISAIFVEGGYGDINTDIFRNMDDKTIKLKILDNLIDNGRLTGAEYFDVKNNSSIPLYGLEDKKVHQENFERLTEIFTNRSLYSTELLRIKNEISYLKAKYFSSEGKRFDAFLESYKNGKISSEKYYSFLKKYINKISLQDEDYNSFLYVSLDRYPAFSLYCDLLQQSKSINYNKASLEMRNLVKQLQETLPHNEFAELSLKTAGFGNADEFVASLGEIGKKYSIDINPDGEFAKLVRYMSAGAGLNVLDFINEEKQVISDIRAAFAENEAEFEIAFLGDFYNRLEAFLDAKVTADEYDYFVREYANFINIYEKYAFKSDLAFFQNNIDLLKKFYEVNIDRNRIFVQNINKKTGAKNGKNGIVVVITGGFHSKGLSDIFKKNKMSYISIIPAVTTGTKRSEEAYYGYVLNTHNFSAQTFALALASQASYFELSRVLISAASSGLNALEYNEENIAALQNALSGMLKQDVKADFGLEESILTLPNGFVITLQNRNGKMNNLTYPDEGIAASNGSRFSIGLKNSAVLSFNAVKNTYSYIFAPNTYSAIKSIMEYAAGNNLITGDGLIFDIEMSEDVYDKIDGIDAELLARMPDFMQHAALKYQQRRDRLSKIEKTVLANAFLAAYFQCGIDETLLDYFFIEPEKSSYEMSEKVPPAQAVLAGALNNEKIIRVPVYLIGESSDLYLDYEDIIVKNAKILQNSEESVYRRVNALKYLLSEKADISAYQYDLLDIRKTLVNNMRAIASYGSKGHRSDIAFVEEVISDNMDLYSDIILKSFFGGDEFTYLWIMHHRNDKSFLKRIIGNEKSSLKLKLFAYMYLRMNFDNVDDESAFYNKYMQNFDLADVEIKNRYDLMAVIAGTQVYLTHLADTLLKGRINIHDNDRKLIYYSILTAAMVKPSETENAIANAAFEFTEAMKKDTVLHEVGHNHLFALAEKSSAARGKSITARILHELFAFSTIPFVYSYKEIPNRTYLSLEHKAAWSIFAVFEKVFELSGYKKHVSWAAFMMEAIVRYFESESLKKDFTDMQAALLDIMAGIVEKESGSDISKNTLKRLYALASSAKKNEIVLEDDTDTEIDFQDVALIKMQPDGNVLITKDKDGAVFMINGGNIYSIEDGRGAYILDSRLFVSLADDTLHIEKKSGDAASVEYISLAPAMYRIWDSADVAVREVVRQLERSGIKQANIFDENNKAEVNVILSAAQKEYKIKFTVKEIARAWGENALAEKASITIPVKKGIAGENSAVNEAEEYAFNENVIRLLMENINDENGDIYVKASNLKELIRHGVGFREIAENAIDIRHQLNNNKAAIDGPFTTLYADSLTLVEELIADNLPYYFENSRNLGLLEKEFSGDEIRFLEVIRSRNDEDKLIETAEKEDTGIKFRLFAFMYLMKNFYEPYLQNDFLNKLLLEAEDILDINVESNFDLKAYIAGCKLLYSKDLNSVLGIKINNSDDMLIWNYVSKAVFTEKNKDEPNETANSNFEFVKVETKTAVHEIAHNFLDMIEKSTFTGFNSHISIRILHELFAYGSEDFFDRRKYIFARLPRFSLEHDIAVSLLNAAANVPRYVGIGRLCNWPAVLLKTIVFYFKKSAEKARNADVAEGFSEQYAELIQTKTNKKFSKLFIKNLFKLMYSGKRSNLLLVNGIFKTSVANLPVFIKETSVENVIMLEKDADGALSAEINGVNYDITQEWLVLGNGNVRIRSIGKEVEIEELKGYAVYIDYLNFDKQAEKLTAEEKRNAIKEVARQFERSGLFPEIYMYESDSDEVENILLLAERKYGIKFSKDEVISEMIADKSANAAASAGLRSFVLPGFETVAVTDANRIKDISNDIFFGLLWEGFNFKHSIAENLEVLLNVAGYSKETADKIKEDFIYRFGISERNLNVLKKRYNPAFRQAAEELYAEGVSQGLKDRDTLERRITAKGYLNAREIANHFNLSAQVLHFAEHKGITYKTNNNYQKYVETFHNKVLKRRIRLSTHQAVVDNERELNRLALKFYLNGSKKLFSADESFRNNPKFDEIVASMHFAKNKVRGIKDAFFDIFGDSVMEMNVKENNADAIAAEAQTVVSEGLNSPGAFKKIQRIERIYSSNGSYKSSDNDLVRILLELGYAKERAYKVYSAVNMQFHRHGKTMFSLPDFKGNYKLFSPFKPAVLPENEYMVDKMVNEGEPLLKILFKIAVAEFFGSLSFDFSRRHPADRKIFGSVFDNEVSEKIPYMYQKHDNDKDFFADGALAVTMYTYMGAFAGFITGIGRIAGLIIGSTLTGGVELAAALGIAVVSAVIAGIAANTAVHMLVDSRAVKEKIALKDLEPYGIEKVKEYVNDSYGFENIDEYINVPVIVVDKKPANPEEFGFVNSGVKTGRKSVWISTKTKALVIFSERPVEEIENVILAEGNKKFLKSASKLIYKSTGVRLNSKNFDVSWTKVINSKAKGISYDERGNVRARINILDLDERQETADFIAAANEIKRADKAAAVESIYFIIDDLDSLENFGAMLENFQKFGNGQLIVDRNDLIEALTLSQMEKFFEVAHANGIKVYADITQDYGYGSAGRLSDMGFDGYFYHNNEEQSYAVRDFIMASDTWVSYIKEYSSAPELRIQLKEAEESAFVLGVKDISRVLVDGNVTAAEKSWIRSLLKGDNLLGILDKKGYTRKSLTDTAYAFNSKHIPQLDRVNGERQKEEIFDALVYFDIEGAKEAMNLNDDNPVSIYLNNIAARTDSADKPEAFQRIFLESVFERMLAQQQTEGALVNKDFEKILGKALREKLAAVPADNIIKVDFGGYKAEKVAEAQGKADASVANMVEIQNAADKFKAEVRERYKERTSFEYCYKEALKYSGYDKQLTRKEGKIVEKEAKRMQKQMKKISFSEFLQIELDKEMREAAKLAFDSRDKNTEALAKIIQFIPALADVKMKVEFKSETLKEFDTRNMKTVLTQA